MRITFEIENEEDKLAMNEFLRQIVARPMSMEEVSPVESEKRNTTLPALKPKSNPREIPPGFSTTDQDGNKWSWNSICSHMHTSSATLGKMKKATGEKYLICHRCGQRSTVLTSETLLDDMREECRTWLKKRGRGVKVE